MSARRKLAAGTRLVAALSLLAFATANLAGLIHQATASHAVCPEHGELVHAEGEADQGPAPRVAARVVPQRRPAGPPQRTDGAAAAAVRVQEHAAAEGEGQPAGPLARGAAPDPSSDEHDHCYIGCGPRDRLAGASQVAAVEPAPQTAGSALAAVAGAQSTGPALYLTAPKTSPPA